MGGASQRPHHGRDAPVWAGDRHEPLPSVQLPVPRGPSQAQRAQPARGALENRQQRVLGVTPGGSRRRRRGRPEAGGAAWSRGAEGLLQAEEGICTDNAFRAEKSPCDEV